MKIYLYAWCAALALALGLGEVARAEEKGVVSQNRANVRGQPAFVGEVVTQLKKGDDVVILEEINLSKPAPGETAKWLKIKMPENTPVWIFAAYIDTNNAVAKPKVNLRAGPGENYSVVGRLEKGDTVKPIRTVEDWMEIETHEKAYAFVAADLVSKGSAAEVAETPKEQPKAAEPPKQVAQAEPVPVKQEPPPAVVATPVVILPTETAVTPAKDTPVEKPKVQEPPVQEAKPQPAPIAVEPKKEEPKPVEKLPEVAPAPAPAPPADPTKRIVRREGIVRTTTSIQAPTYFELVSPETRKTINYIHTEKSGINIKQFRGKKIIISGEEMIDPRWPNTPVIEVETLDYTP